MENTGVLRELNVCMHELSTAMRVYVVSGRFTEAEPDLPELAARIRALLLGAVVPDPAWARYLSGYTPPGVEELASVLEPVETREAAAFLAGVASVDLLWPNHHHTPSQGALRAATRAVSLLGPEATWWTNHDAEGGAVYGLTPLCDSVIAGTDGEYFAIALQIADD